MTTDGAITEMQQAPANEARPGAGAINEAGGIWQADGTYHVDWNPAPCTPRIMDSVISTWPPAFTDSVERYRYLVRQTEEAKAALRAERTRLQARLADLDGILGTEVPDVTPLPPDEPEPKKRARGITEAVRAMLREPARGDKDHLWPGGWDGSQWASWAAGRGYNTSSVAKAVRAVLKEGAAPEIVDLAAALQRGGESGTGAGGAP